MNQGVFSPPGAPEPLSEPASSPPRTAPTFPLPPPPPPYMAPAPPTPSSSGSQLTLVLGILLAVAVVATVALVLVGVRPKSAETNQLEAMALQPADLGTGWSVVRESPALRDDNEQKCRGELWHGDRGFVRTMTTHGAGRRGVVVSAVYLTSSDAEAGAHRTFVDSDAFSACLLNAVEAELSSTIPAGEDGAIYEGSVGRFQAGLASAATAYEVTVPFRERGLEHTFVLREFHLFSGPNEAVVQVAFCDCNPLGVDEISVLNQAARRLENTGGAAVAASTPTTSILPTTTTGSTLPFAETGNACSLLTGEQVDSIIGLNKGPATSDIGDGSRQCTWLGREKSIVIQTGVTDEQFAVRLRETDQGVTGVGDQAAASSQFPGQLLARRGARWVKVFVTGTSDDRGNAMTLGAAALDRT